MWNQPKTRVFELLEDHFKNVGLDSLTTTSRTFPARVRADLQRALDQHVNGSATSCVGVRCQHFHDNIDTASLFSKNRGARQIAPLHFEEVDVGEPEPARCLANAVWLTSVRGIPACILLSGRQDHFGNESRVIEITGPIGSEIASYTNDLFQALESQIKEASTYRGKVLSLEQAHAYSGQSSGIFVHRLPKISRSEIILPDAVLELLDRSIIEFTQQTNSLVKFGQSTKRGVLLYGAPGTGKTHTIRYIASRLPRHTTLLITAEQVGLLEEYFALARLLQPSIMVIEDADLIARNREMMGGTCEEVLLNKLLNNMDGLREDAEILFLLTTNRPSTLEEALADRPGRIDQSIEFPKPDDECRARLLELYAGQMHISADLKKVIVDRTEGVSAAFIKELARRILQFALSRSGTADIQEIDVAQAIEDMLFTGGRLNASLLGGEASG